MKHPVLIEVHATAESARSKLVNFKRKHGIKTWRTPGMRREDDPWIAILPISKDLFKDIGTIMAESCRLYDESGKIAYGKGELSAVRTLCEQTGLKFDLK